MTLNDNDKENIFWQRTFLNLLNATDFRILALINKPDISVNELGRVMNMSGVNVWKHLKKLKRINLIEIPEAKRGMKKYPRIKNTSFAKSIAKNIISITNLSKEENQRLMKISEKNLSEEEYQNMLRKKT